MTELAGRLVSDYDALRRRMFEVVEQESHSRFAATAPGGGVGGHFDDTHALVLSVGSGIGDMVNWSNGRMLSDVQAWVDGSLDNFGWMLIGEEWITEDQQVIRPDNGKLANASSKIDFHSGETASPYYTPPWLTVTYHVVPEPSSILLLMMGLGTFWWRWCRHS